jgi:hypothetical protein
VGRLRDKLRRGDLSRDELRELLSLVHDAIGGVDGDIEDSRESRRRQEWLAAETGQTSEETRPAKERGASRCDETAKTTGIGAERRHARYGNGTQTR